MHITTVFYVPFLYFSFSSRRLAVFFLFSCFFFIFSFGYLITCLNIFFHMICLFTYTCAFWLQSLQICQECAMGKKDNKIIAKKKSILSRNRNSNKTSKSHGKKINEHINFTTTSDEGIDSWAYFFFEKVII